VIGISSFVRCVTPSDLAALGRLPFKETVHRHDTAALAVSFAEHRPGAHGLCHGIDWFRPVRGILAPRRNETPLEQVERSLANLVALADDKQFLARSAIIARRDIRKPAIGHVQPIDELVTKRARHLNNSSAHGLQIVQHMRGSSRRDPRPQRNARVLAPFSRDGATRNFKRSHWPVANLRCKKWPGLQRAQEGEPMTAWSVPSVKADGLQSWRRTE
jgi:hypothetical protein